MKDTIVDDFLVPDEMPWNVEVCLKYFSDGQIYVN